MNNWCICWFFMHALNAELKPISHLLALLGGANIVVISRLRVKGSASHPGRFPPPSKDPVPIVHDAGWAPGPVWIIILYNIHKISIFDLHCPRLLGFMHVAAPFQLD